MVDFNKLMGVTAKSKETDPILIFKQLDKASGKEYLRPPQETILREWNEKFRTRKDAIVKLHTGQGKTLIGLLMLQSCMNEDLGPSVFLCPNKYLVHQTIKEAQSFGIKTVGFTDETRTNSLPLEFLNSEAILITNCKKMFNGKTVFGTIDSGREIIQLGAIVIDDAHACIDIIRNSFSINVNRKKLDKTESPLYKELWDLFQESIKRQESGTHIEIQAGDDSLIAVPYWAWQSKQQQVLQILSKYKDDSGHQDLVFAWDLLKNKLPYCTCIFSGTRLQIAPRVIPIEMIPSFFNAKRKILLSATLMEDAFLVRDLNIEPSSVTEPLIVREMKYSGERMVLIPTLLDTSLKRETLIIWLSRFVERNGNFGIVTIVPSFKKAEDWEREGGAKTFSKNIVENIEQIKSKIESGMAKHITVLVNQYDGIDLPDNTCRVLCLDSMPTQNSLIDSYIQKVRSDSDLIRRQQAQRIEQGMGRAIRGSSDYCVVIITGNNLTGFLSENSKRAFLSNETNMQIKIAEEVADDVRHESGNKLDVIEALIKQCINRDAGWKDYYRDRMEGIKSGQSNESYLQIAILEREAESQYQEGQIDKAVQCIRKILDQSKDSDKGWYFQLLATYLYHRDITDAMDKQRKAFSINKKLHRPEEGIIYSKLGNTTNREEWIIDWIKKHDSPSSLIVDLMNVLDKISFNAPAESFEEGVEELGKILGFESQRPEKESEKGPDNLWNLGGKSYWSISCKNMVKSDREVISKKETGQMNNEMAWFKEIYDGCTATHVFIHPANTLDSDAFLTETAHVITEENLNKLKQNIQNFYNTITQTPFADISKEIVKQRLAEAHLDVFNLTRDHLERVHNHQ